MKWKLFPKKLNALSDSVRCSFYPNITGSYHLVHSGYLLMPRLSVMGVREKLNFVLKFHKNFQTQFFQNSTGGIKK